jgi:hypothetical protein
MMLTSAIFMPLVVVSMIIQFQAVAYVYDGPSCAMRMLREPVYLVLFTVGSQSSKFFLCSSIDIVAMDEQAIHGQPGASHVAPGPSTTNHVLVDDSSHDMTSRD